MPANLKNSAVATGQEKVSFHSNPNEIAFISHASKVMLKILQARLQQYMNRELLDVQAEFIPSEEPEIKLPASTGSSKKQESSRKTSISALLTMPKPLTVWITTVENSLRDQNTRPHYLPPEKSVCRSRSKLELNMEQQTGSKLGKEYVKAVYCHPAYSTYMQSTSCKMLGWMKHKLESRLLGEISVTSDTQMTPLLNGRK